MLSICILIQLIVHSALLDSSTHGRNDSHHLTRLNGNRSILLSAFCR